MTLLYKKTMKNLMIDKQKSLQGSTGTKMELKSLFGQKNRYYETY